MQHSDSQRIDTTTLVFLKNPMCVRARVSVVVVVCCFDVLLFVCVNQRDLRETFGILPCGLIEYSCVLFSRRLRRLRRGMQQAALFRRERQVGMVKAVVGFVVLSAIISEICERLMGFLCAI